MATSAANYYQLVLMIIVVTSISSMCPIDCNRNCTNCLTTIDQCGCCPICNVVGVNATCGANRTANDSLSGSIICDSDLHCVDGRCVMIGRRKLRRLTTTEESTTASSASAMWPERCLKAKCAIVFQPNCPDDSKLVVVKSKQSKDVDDDCCLQPGECQCDFEQCHQLAPICKRGFERVRLAIGNRRPGNCCDLFECQQRKIKCTNVKCPQDVDDVHDCPPDSIRPPSYVPDGGCCQVTERVPQLIDFSCQCKAGICRPADCGVHDQLDITHKGDGTPGNCCDQFICQATTTTAMNDTSTPAQKICPYNGRMYREGEIWYSTTCEQCKCKAGVAFCMKMQCPAPPQHCSWIGIADGDCCPICLGCKTDTGMRLHHNDTWNKDECTSCVCSSDGEPLCQRHMCQVQCDNPRKVVGQCCPVCDEPILITMPSVCPSIAHCPLRCEYGLQRDDRGCFQCVCTQGANTDASGLPALVSTTNENCQLLTEENCEKQCAHGYVRDSDGCARCKCAKCPPLHQCYKHCLYDFETNAIGCAVCKCRAMRRLASPIPTIVGVDADVKCESFTNGRSSMTRDSGEWWNDGCRHCFCENGHEFCSLISCPTRPDACPASNWIQSNDECCPTCKWNDDLAAAASISIVDKHQHTVCQSPGTGQMFVDGETWQLASCVSCTCRVGHVLCHIQPCPPIACEHPIFTDDDRCCAKCPDEQTQQHHLQANQDIEPVMCTDERGLGHVDGASWRSDECTSCRCKADGTDHGVQCYRESCEDFGKCNGLPLMLKGRCCPVCSDSLSRNSVCEYNRNVYSQGEQWKDGACRNCTCSHAGQTVCTELQCAPCINTLLSERAVGDNQCCATCKDTTTEWLSIGDGSRTTGGHHPSINLLLAGTCVGLVVVIIIAVLLIVWLAQRNRIHRKMTKTTTTILPSATSNGALTSKDYVGSAAMLPIGVDGCLLPKVAATTSCRPSRHRSSCDGQSESLLSTTSSECSAAPSTASSSSAAGGPHYDTSTLPLTGGTANHRKSADCHCSGSDALSPTSDMQFGKFTRSFGSFRRKSSPQKQLAKHLSCNV